MYGGSVRRVEIYMTAPNPVGFYPSWRPISQLHRPVEDSARLFGGPCGTSVAGSLALKAS